MYVRTQLLNAGNELDFFLFFFVIARRMFYKKNKKITRKIRKFKKT